MWSELCLYKTCELNIKRDIKKKITSHVAQRKLILLSAYAYHALLEGESCFIHQTNSNLDTNEVIVHVNPVGWDFKLLLTWLSLLKISLQTQVSLLYAQWNHAKIFESYDFTSFFVGVDKEAVLKVFSCFSTFTTSQCPNLSPRVI